MRLSLWQQFSSNHSANFDVVGSFTSPEEAEHAAQEVRFILKQLRDWWSSEAGHEWGQKEPDDESETVTPIEVELSRKYSLEWPFSVNWYRWQWDYEESPVSTFENHVFIQNPHPYIWKGPQPFNSLLERLGGKVAIDVSDSRSHANEALLMDAVCQLPADELTALVLFERFKEDFAAVKEAYQSGSMFRPQIEFPFRYDNVMTILASEDIRVFEAELVGEQLFLYGIDIGEVYQLSEALPEFIQFLKAEGCTGISYSFHSSPIVGWRWESSER